MSLAAPSAPRRPRSRVRRVAGVAPAGQDARRGGSHPLATRALGAAFTLLFAGLVAGCGEPAAPIAASQAAPLTAPDGETLHVVALRLPGALPDLKDPRAAIAAAQDAVLARLGLGEAEVVRRYVWTPGLALRIEDSTVVEKLRAMPEVEAVDPDVKVAPNLNSSVTFIRGHLLRATGVNGVERFFSPPSPLTASGTWVTRPVKVAVIDTGVDPTHPELAGAVTAGACFAANGAVDNCCYNLQTSGTTLASAADDDWHGTHVSGIIAGRGVLAIPNVAPSGLPGVAPAAQLVVVRTLCQGTGYTSDSIAALDWLRTNHPDAAAVNMSLGTGVRFAGFCDQASADYTPPAWITVYASAVAALRSAGVLTIAAAGNDADAVNLSAPACLSNVVAVGGSGRNNNSLYFNTNSNSTLDLWAPAVNIISAVPGGFAALSGTSMAAPHVSGAVALIQHVATQGNLPRRTPDEVVTCLRSPAQPMILDPWNGVIKPRLDLPTVVAACSPHGGACAADADCAGGLCVDGRCCNSACGAGAGDCQACSAAGGSLFDGLCLPISSANVCRAAAGDCDVAEVCSGTTIACPANALRSASTTCRAASGPCDAPEMCTGATASCPADAVQPSGVTCRASAGVCDVAETCTGGAKTCPGDFKRSDTCRPAAGPCDLAEACDGSGNSCPEDERLAAGTVCRAMADACDVVETCSGAGPSCPEDQGLLACCEADEACSDGNACTVDTCSPQGGCLHAAVAGCCNANADCAAGQACLCGVVGCVCAADTDSDGDGALDATDAAPSDPRVVAITHFPSEGASALLGFEDQWPERTDLDFNDVVVRVHQRIERAQDGRVARLTMTIDPLAAGGQHRMGLGLQLPATRDGLVARRRLGLGAWTDLPLEPDAQATVRVVNEVRGLFGGTSERVNVEPGEAELPGERVEVELLWTVPVDLVVGQAPFDLFVFRTVDPAHEVHFPPYAGTQGMRTSLFGTGLDASTAARRFVLSGGLPSALNLMNATAFPSEATRIETVFPEIVTFALTGGDQGGRFYRAPAAAASKVLPPPVALPATPPAAPALEACAVPNGTGARLRRNDLLGPCVPTSCQPGHVRQGAACVPGG